MNAVRFLKKCLTDQPAAWRSIMLVSRAIYGDIYWKLNPTAPLRHYVPGGVLLLEPGHVFTLAFWPAVEQFEPDVREFLKATLKPGATFIDCGSNIGYFSVLSKGLLGPSGTLVAIEANPMTFKLLTRNLDANQFGTPVHCAITDTPGEVEIFAPTMGDVYTSLRKGGLVVGDGVRSWKVPGRTLDDVIAERKLSRVDVVKIDIEGGELAALRSAKECMEKLRPMFIIEYSTMTWPGFGATPQGLQDLCREHDYQIRQFDVSSKRLVDVSPAVWDRPYENLVLVPLAR